MRETGEQIHRRETRRHIWLPFVVTALCVLLAFSIVALANQPLARSRAAAIADLSLTLLCLVPLLACALPAYIIVWLGVVSMIKLHNSTESPLRRLENLTTNTADRIEGLTTHLNQRVINWQARLAPIMAIMQRFDGDPRREDRATHDTTDQSSN